MTKATADIRSLARAHTDTAIRTLASIMNGEEQPPAARVQAATSLLDRGWGKPTQTIAGDPDNPIHTHNVIEQRIVDPAD